MNFAISAGNGNARSFEIRWLSTNYKSNVLPSAQKQVMSALVL